MLSHNSVSYSCLVRTNRRVNVLEWGVRLSPFGTSANICLLYQPRMIDDECGINGGLRIGKGNRSTRRKSAPVLLCAPQIPHDLTSNPDRRRGKPATNRTTQSASKVTVSWTTRTSFTDRGVLLLATESAQDCYIWLHPVCVFNKVHMCIIRTSRLTRVSYRFTVIYYFSSLHVSTACTHN
jgi:hypothetical protein